MVDAPQLKIPPQKIAVIPVSFDNSAKPFQLKEIDSIITPLNKSKERDWFSSIFYKCLPLSIGNMQGFVVKVPFEFDVFWNGGPNREDCFFKFYDDEKKFNNKSHIIVHSHFGYGIFTIGLPLIFKTPAQINLMTIAPPNFPTPGLSPMTGVIETDNLDYTFTLNIKIDITNTWIKVLPNTPLVGIIPIPRYFCDSFEMVDAKQILKKEEIDTILKHHEEQMSLRSFLSDNNINYGKDQTYFMGKNIRGEKYQDHQLPKIKK